MNNVEQLATALIKSNLDISEICNRLKNIEILQGYCQSQDMDQLKFLGFPLEEVREKLYTLKTKNTNCFDQEFCVVDIETNGNTVQKGQIIEIGAYIIKKGIIMDKFHSLVYAKTIPEPIIELTGIKESDLKYAPSLKEVLIKFRFFLDDRVFVAHNANFDYGFISDSMLQNNLGILLNRKLCTIELAKRVVKAERYGLGYLINYFDIKIAKHHRALSDAYASAKILDFCLNKLPQTIQTTEEIIHFSRSKINAKEILQLSLHV